MLMAAAEITQVVARGRDAFDEDVVLRRAVERCLEIIGEKESHPRVPRS
jgi:uncharacterized protein with HEPN domain